MLEAYAHTRRDAPDRDLLRRARLSGELAVARWLLHGTTTGDEGVVADAVAMLGTRRGTRRGARRGRLVARSPAPVAGWPAGGGAAGVTA